MNEHVIDKRPETITTNVVIVDKIHETVSILNMIDESAGLGAIGIQVGPMRLPYCEGFILAKEKII